MESWYDEVYRDSSRYGLRVTERLFEGRSDFQRVEVVETVQWGRVLILDGIFMTSEGDEHFYHEMLVHPALCSVPSPRRVLVIGGGDGGTIREVLRHPEVERCVMVEIDGLVVEVSKKYLGTVGTAWDDPRLDLRIADGIRYVAETDEGPFDVVLLDGTDPVGPGKGLFNEAFYRNVARVLAPKGVFALQSESPILTLDVFYEIQATLRRVFPRVHPYFGPAPLYCAGQWSWTHASTSVDPLAADPGRIERVESGSRYYDREIHRASFALPNEVRRRLAQL